MSIRLDIVEAIDAQGGYAAIRVSGLDALPADPTFRIDPIDDALKGETAGDWPSGPRRPTAVKVGDGSFDLVLGSDVLESALLIPGTSVIVTINDTAASAALNWPSIATRQPRPRRPVIVTEQLRQQEQEAAEAKRREAAARLAEASARLEPVGDISVGVAQSLGTSGPIARQTSNRATADQRVLSGFSQQRPIAGLTAAQLVRNSGRKIVEVPLTSPSGPSANKATPTRQRLARQIGAFAGGLVVAGALVYGLIAFRYIDIFPVGKVAGGTPDVALTLARNSHTLRTVLTTGGISPRGRSAAGVDGPTALRLADAYLHGSADTPRDQGEASFWLRHALAQPTEHEAMKWAYTQLGSIYAQPEGFPPDYVKARLLWEIAGALGDPVALCFNAALYEHGLGVPKHRDIARALYERARGAGGCKGVDDAVKRTSN